MGVYVRQRPLPTPWDPSSAPRKRQRGFNEFEDISTIRNHSEINGEAESPVHPVSMEPSHGLLGVCSSLQGVARPFMGVYVRQSAAFLDELPADFTDPVDYFVKGSHDEDSSFYPSHSDESCEDSRLETDADSVFSVESENTSREADAAGFRTSDRATTIILDDSCDEDPSFHLPPAEQPCEDSWSETVAESCSWVDLEGLSAEHPCEDTRCAPDADRFRFGDPAPPLKGQYKLRAPPDYHDTRFDHRKKEKWYRCDGCSKNVFYRGQAYPHDGYWLESKSGISIDTFHDRWLAGENFTWYCTQCHALRLGYGTGNLADAFARIKLGLVFHAMNRRKQFVRITSNS